MFLYNIYFRYNSKVIFIKFFYLKNCIYIYIYILGIKYTNVYPKRFSRQTRVNKTIKVFN